MTRFPVLWPHGDAKRREMERLGAPKDVPFALVAGCEAQAQRNHGQTLQRLAERGGLSLTELCAVLDGRSWLPWSPTPESELIAFIHARIRTLNAGESK